MTAEVAEPTEQSESHSVVGDLSAWIIAGRVTAESARQGLTDAVDAERLGFNRVFMSERYSVKEAGSVLGGVGALTTRIGYGTGLIALNQKSPFLSDLNRPL